MSKLTVVNKVSKVTVVPGTAKVVIVNKPTKVVVSSKLAGGTAGDVIGDNETFNDNLALLYSISKL